MDDNYFCCSFSCSVRGPLHTFHHHMPDYIYFMDYIWQASHPKGNVFMPERETKAMQAKRKADGGSERLVAPLSKTFLTIHTVD